MFKEQIRQLALENGFKLKEQADGSLDLNQYVYEFAEALMQTSSSARTEMTERERFEAAYENTHKPIIARPYPKLADGSYQYLEIGQAWELWQAATAQAVPQVEGDEYLVVNFGYGDIEVAEGISEDVYALMLGNNGGGAVGADLRGNRYMTKQETLAVLKFHSLASIDVVLDRLNLLRKRMKNNEPVEIKNNDGEVIKVVKPKLQAAQENDQ